MSFLGVLGQPAVPFTEQQKEDFAGRAPDDCRRKIDPTDRFLCEWIEKEFQQGGTFEYYPNLPKYLAINGGVAVAAFVSVFVFIFLIPVLARGLARLGQRYWEWLNT